MVCAVVVIRLAMGKQNKIKNIFSKNCHRAEIEPYLNSANRAELHPIFLHSADLYPTLLPWAECIILLFPFLERCWAIIAYLNT